MGTKRATRTAPTPGDCLESVTLARPHTHAGALHPAGAMLHNVHQGDAALMRQFGVLAPDADAALPTTIADAAPDGAEPKLDDRAVSWPCSDGRNWGIRFVCPGCKADGKMAHHAVCTEEGFTGPRWGFNGDLARPTVTPSILARYNWPDEPVVCHSFVRDGRIQYLDDCTHSMAGQTVDLPVYTEAETDADHSAPAPYGGA